MLWILGNLNTYFLLFFCIRNKQNKQQNKTINKTNNKRKILPVVIYSSFFAVCRNSLSLLRTWNEHGCFIPKPNNLSLPETHLDIGCTRAIISIMVLVHQAGQSGRQIELFVFNIIKMFWRGLAWFVYSFWKHVYGQYSPQHFWSM